jgi:hypothetical protein
VLYGVWLQGLIKTMKNLRQDNLCWPSSLYLPSEYVGCIHVHALRNSQGTYDGGGGDGGGEVSGTIGQKCEQLIP